MWGFGEKPNMRVFITSLNAAVIFSVASYALIHSSLNSNLRKSIGVVYGILSIFLIARSVYAFFLMLLLASIRHTFYSRWHSWLPLS
jgi:hypothetical protein